MKVTSGRIAVLFLIVAYVLMGWTGLYASWGMPAPAQVALVLLLIAATLWISESIPLFVTSFIVLFLAQTWLRPTMLEAGLVVDSQTFLSPFFSNIILLFLGGFVLSSALNKYNLDEQMARWIIGLTGRSVPKLMLAIMGITAFLSMWLSNTATAAMMLSLILPMVQRLPKEDRYRKSLILSIPFAANIGGLGTPIGSPPNAIAMQYMGEIGVAPSFNQWMMIGIPGTLSIIGLAWLLLLFLYRGKAEVEAPEKTSSPLVWTPATITVVAGAVLTVLGWVTTSWHGQSAGTVAMIPLILFFGTGILKVGDLRSLSWDVLMLMGGGLCLGAAIAKSGLAEWVVGLLPVEGVGIYGITVAFGFLACFMSSIMSNTATANLLMPIILGLSLEPLSPILVGVAFACSLAMPLPISTPPNAMAFSSGEIRVKDMVRPGLILTVIGVVLALTVGYWFWDRVGIW